MDGWAVANPSQSDAYVAAEKMARDASVGIWRGSFVLPSDFLADIAATKSYPAQVSASIWPMPRRHLAPPQARHLSRCYRQNAGAKERAAMTDQHVLVPVCRRHSSTMRSTRDFQLAGGGTRPEDWRVRSWLSRHRRRSLIWDGFREPRTPTEKVKSE
jgi:hypothetical protein